MLFRTDIEPSCSYCLHGTDIGRDEIACRNRGIMAAGGRCGAFCYEPTKREPEFARSLKIPDMPELDFSL